MPISPYASLVIDAERRRKRVPSQSIAALRESLSIDDNVQRLLRTYAPWAQELEAVNDHITVRYNEIDEAITAYEEVAQHLRKQLDWPEEATHVFPQGSASTRTLIRSPIANEKFDIDAVCQVDINHIDAYNPIDFFDKVGEALRRYEPKRKNRCWNINFASNPFYLELTPSVPLDTVPINIRASITETLRPVENYRDTALAVVDNDTQQWKTSNPAGISRWVNDIAKRQLLSQQAFVALTSLRETASVESVPDQDVDITDTLRISIRLFKRHRDICARRGRIDKEVQPISIILVTLLTSCYAGLHDLGRPYQHPVELLVDLSELLPGMTEFRNGKHWVANPTVEGENFAEKWNQDDGVRSTAFKTWCDILAADLRTILATTDPKEIRETVGDVFGITGSTNPSTGLFASAGLIGTPATRRPPPPPPKTRGLA
ncbi:MAG: hypothetical protein A2514_16030 [Gammaproteobacteria bacterium RIFOXYD12_FULL_61_37]|nr:MAG: hypothetical protein A2514_16030 [Gammaproteobacteria bacterium RIFOXYD12_FULL_61_37]